MYVWAELEFANVGLVRAPDAPGSPPESLLMVTTRPRFKLNLSAELIRLKPMLTLVRVCPAAYPAGRGPVVNAWACAEPVFAMVWPLLWLVWPRLAASVEEDTLTAPAQVRN